jgi:hypothetical protein
MSFKHFPTPPKSKRRRLLKKRLRHGKAHYYKRGHYPLLTGCSECGHNFIGEGYNVVYKGRNGKWRTGAYEGMWSPLCPDCFNQLEMVN